jgi:hypothetical protein
VFERVASHLLAEPIERCACHRGDHGTTRCEDKETDVNANRLEALYALERRCSARTSREVGFFRLRLGTERRTSASCLRTAVRGERNDARTA